MGKGSFPGFTVLICLVWCPWWLMPYQLLQFGGPANGILSNLKDAANVL